MNLFNEMGIGTPEENRRHRDETIAGIEHFRSGALGSSRGEGE